MGTHGLLRLTALALVSFLLFAHCTQDSPLQPDSGVTPQLSDLVVPQTIYRASTRTYLVSVRVSDPQGLADVATVTFSITPEAGGTALAEGALADAGTDGDIIAGDGIYTAPLGAAFATADSGVYVLRTRARDRAGNESNTLSAAVTVRPGTENQPPEIRAVQAPDRVAVDSAFTFLVTAEVQDADGLSDVEQVVYEFFPPAHPNPTITSQLLDNGLFGDARAGDGIFTVSISSGLFDRAADYFLRIQARDQAGNASAPALVLIRGFAIGNRPPVLSNLVAPDTVRIDPTRVTKILMTVDVQDPQGLSDIVYVRFRSFLPNGNEAQDSPFAMSDDGDTANTGDVTAGDGTYSIIINLPPTGVQPGNFRFVFQAKDRSNALSNEIEHIMTVVN